MQLYELIQPDWPSWKKDNFWLCHSAWLATDRKGFGDHHPQYQTFWDGWIAHVNYVRFMMHYGVNMGSQSNSGTSKRDERPFSIQTIRAEEETHYRITHTETDSRIATCHDYLNATYVCEALNVFALGFGRDYMEMIKRSLPTELKPHVDDI